MIVQASVDTVKGNFIVDTGAAKTVVDLSFARSQNLAVQESTIQVCGLGTSRMVLYKIKSATMMVGEFTLVLPQLHAIDLRHVKQTLREKGVDRPANGIIGADVLNHHKAIIDYANQLLYLQKQPVFACSD